MNKKMKECQLRIPHLKFPNSKIRSISMLPKKRSNLMINSKLTHNNMKVIMIINMIKISSML